MNKKYLIKNFSSCGMCNVLEELEIGLALSYITGRTLIIPNLIDKFCLPDKSIKYDSLWNVFDLDLISKEFDIEYRPEIENYVDLQEYQNKLGINLSEISILHEWLDSAIDKHLYHSEISDVEDFKLFMGPAEVRTETKDVRHNSKYLAVGRGRADFFYIIYPGGPAHRNKLKRKINRALMPKVKFSNFVLDTQTRLELKTFNAVHVRYAVFFDTDPTNYIDIKPHMVDIKNNPDILLKQILKLFEQDIPLYISTDIHTAGKEYIPPVFIDLNQYLDPLKKYYKVICYDDLNLKLSRTEESVFEIMMCANANKFYGTFGSTYSKRINRIRGHIGNQTCDYMGWNFIQPPWNELDTAFPWNELKKSWNLLYSNYLAYRYEKED